MMKILVALLMFLSCTAPAQNNPALLDASSNGDTETVRKLLDQKVNVNIKDKNGITALILAARFGHEEIARMLIDSGADADYEAPFGYTALLYAAWGGYKEIASMLIKKRVRICNIATFLSSAASLLGFSDNIPGQHFWDVEMAEMLIKAGANVREKDKEGRRPLTRAANEGNKDLAVLLIKAGADVNDTDNNGFSPLMASSSRGHKEIAEILLALRAQVDKKASWNGFTALTFAVSRPRLQEESSTLAKKKVIVELLVKAGADVNVKSKNGDTPIITAARYSSAEVVGLLIKAGANVNAKGEFGMTALIWLSDAFLGQKIPDALEKAKILIDSGADVNAKDNEGYTALKMAKKNHINELAELLRKAGAK